MTLTFGSLFAGIGGFDIALERAGMVCRWQVEIDKKCQQVLAHHWPNVERMNDVKEITAPEPVDLICGGFPCQDVSVAGRRKGLDGERSGLWFEFLRIIANARPQWVVIENVPGLLSSNERRDFATILQGLAESGYWWAYRVLDAQYWGVPQRRRRVFVVASLGDWRGPVQVLFESESSPWDTAPRREAGKRVAAPIKASSPSRRAGGSAPIADEFVAQTFTVRTGKPGGGKGYLGFDDGAMTLGGQSQWLAQPLAAHHGRNCGEDTFAPVFCADVSPTLQKESYSPTKTSTGQALDWCVIQRPGVRRFTPLECERLQGFPDGWTDVNGMSDSARYKMLGNAVAVPVVQWLGERIMKRCAA